MFIACFWFFSRTSWAKASMPSSTAPQMITVVSAADAVPAVAEASTEDGGDAAAAVTEASDAPAGPAAEMAAEDGGDAGAAVTEAADAPAGPAAADTADAPEVVSSEEN